MVQSKKRVFCGRVMSHWSFLIAQFPILHISVYNWWYGYSASTFLRGPSVTSSSSVFFLTVSCWNSPKLTYKAITVNFLSDSAFWQLCCCLILMALMKCCSIWGCSKAPPHLGFASFLPANSKLSVNLRYDIEKCSKWECCCLGVLAQRASTHVEDEKPNVAGVHSSGADDMVQPKGFHKDVNLLPSELYLSHLSHYKIYHFYFLLAFEEYFCWLLLSHHWVILVSISHALESHFAYRLFYLWFPMKFWLGPLSYTNINIAYLESYLAY